MSRAKPDSPDDLANAPLELSSPSRRRFLLDTAAIAAAAWLPTNSWGTGVGQAIPSTPSNEGKGDPTMDGKITTRDGVQIYYKDWGKGQPIVFSHGWPLSADDWDAQMQFFLKQGYRVIAHDRRGHGRSTQTATGNDMDHYADDLAELTAHLSLKDAIHVGHSTGGGEVVRYIARHGQSRVARGVIISAVPPLMVRTPTNPGGLPKELFDGFQAQTANNRAQFFYDVPAGPFYGYNRPGAKAAQGVIWNWWRQGMMGGAKAHYDCIVAFSQTDFTEDLKKITVPVLVMHGDDDQIVPYADSAPLSAKLLKNSTLKTYKGFPHGMPTTNADTINADLLAWLRTDNRSSYNSVRSEKGSLANV
jgi:non-heme chloroperoxidase